MGNLVPRKAQEMFCYLLIHRDRPHLREIVADVLWPDSPNAQPRKCLRQALWRLQAVLDRQTARCSNPLFLVEPDWIRLNPEAGLWLDVEVFEQAFAAAQGIPGQELDTESVQTMQAATRLYRGDLLEGWYQDWCLFERERLQSMYLGMLEKLMVYCEAHGAYEDGLTYGTCVLRYDVARERTHRRLIRLHHLAGNRTAALRQYERCVAALREELDVGPSERTVALYERIRSGGPISQATSQDMKSSTGKATTLSRALSHLRLLQTAFAETQRQLQQTIQVVEMVLDG